MALSPALREAIADAGFQSPTPVQQQAIPLGLEGADLMVQAKTGSGKTAAFALPLLLRIENEGEVGRTTALVLCPTRELAEQVANQVRLLAKRIPNVKVLTLCGGVPAREQVPALEHAPQIVVGTPGRILDHLERQTLDLSGVQTLVLDEADRLLDMGFEESVGAIAEGTPLSRQTLLFSATIGPEVKRLSRAYQQQAKSLVVDSADVVASVDETFFEVLPAEKVDASVALLAHHQPEQALVFCVTKNDARAVTKALCARGFSALALHGDLNQPERDSVFAQFLGKSAQVLVATDVAARGLDVSNLPMVLSFELPTNVDVHVHRTGRTGRAGESGTALHLVSHSERRRADAIEKQLGREAKWGRIPAMASDFRAPQSPYVTLVVSGGRKDKLRPGDVLGALTGVAGLAADDVGKILVHPARTYVAVKRSVAKRAAADLSANKIKKRKFRVSLAADQG